MEEQNLTPDQNPQQAANAAAAAPAPEAAAAGADEIARLTQQVAELEAKAKEHYDMFLRATAEGENIRRRSQDEVAKAHKFAIENFADNLVPVMDSLQAALADPEAGPQAATALRALIDRIVLTPNPDGRGVSIQVEGRLAGIVALATGREPPESLTVKMERVKGIEPSS